MKLALLLLGLTALAFAQTPVYPQQYYVKGVFSIPYFNISEPIELWYDAVNNRQVFSYYNGMDVVITLQNTTYAISPVIDTLTCQYAVGDFGPLTNLFVDLSSWKNMGSTYVNNVAVQDYRSLETDYGETAQFDFYATDSGVPVQLLIDGVDFIFDSHPDIYVMDYGLYVPNYVDENAFNVPSICQNASQVDMSKLNLGFAATVMNGLAKKVKEISHEQQFSAFMSKYGKEYADEAEYKQRLAAFKDNVEFINKHNSDPTKTHKVGINHYADLTQEEFRSTYLPKKGRTPSKATHSHKNVPAVPASVDWRTVGAVTPVKDQGVCGSCFTFGSTGSLEGVYQLATGNLISLSEQQIVDCSWKQGNAGCNGGEASWVYDWLLLNGGIATEEEYPYLMQNGWCRASEQDSGVSITGYVNVTTGEDNLLNAVGSVGPVAVAIDASHPEFRFYMSGVYYQADCGNGMDDLDHEVLAVGYGTYNGQDYWLVKNSWSTHWGMEGYTYMARNQNNNCGIATQPTYPLV